MTQDRATNRIHAAVLDTLSGVPFPSTSEFASERTTFGPKFFTDVERDPDKWVKALYVRTGTDVPSYRVLRDFFEAALSVPSPSIREAVEWQPIETAPKDGRDILGYPKNGTRPDLIRYEMYDAETAEEVGEPGYWRYSEDMVADVAAIDSAADEFTHWRPLPPPPGSEPSSALAERVHYAEGVADLAMKHRDEAEAALAEAVEVIREARNWLLGQPERSTCKSETLNELIDSLAAFLASHSKGE